MDSGVRLCIKKQSPSRLFKESSQYVANGDPRPSLASHPCYLNQIPNLTLPPLPPSTTATMFRRRKDIFEPQPLSPFTCSIETLDFSVFPEESLLSLPLPFFNPKHGLFDLRALPFAVFHTVTDLIPIQKNPSSSCQPYRRIKRRTGSGLVLTGVVKASFEEGDKKHRWTAEIRSTRKDTVDRKYKWTAEINGAKCSKLTPEIKGKHSDDIWTVEIKGPKSAAGECSRSFFWQERWSHCQGVKAKRKVLSPQDAALMVQMNFKIYWVPRSQSLQAMRELALAKNKLKELRALFNNFCIYRRCIAHDAEQRQMFSERIIVLLLTVDAIEGIDLMVRAARRSMVNVLEAMLDVTDPQLPRKMGSVRRRRKFDLPAEESIQKEIAAGVAEVVQMLDQEDKYGSDNFETCLMPLCFPQFSTFPILRLLLYKKLIKKGQMVQVEAPIGAKQRPNPYIEA
ncbi:LOW QUALITY PROTEIN: BAG family molecular chaperone regulator 7 [Vitis riparia]|uniref:LOW QUALITY PROTEIN: BAG family molecular chaperone regulator 7 n=1 Tax=Vitis riparia TaxID=96939 RepID=UPI00155B28FC|nr:LOW QUALITY PROTEIN: BAG family molecular chaperone regulator 7 [Vitis riparia]